MISLSFNYERLHNRNDNDSPYWHAQLDWLHDRVLENIQNQRPTIMPEFEFTDKTVQFEYFAPRLNQTLAIYLPSATKSGRPIYARLSISDADWALYLKGNRSGLSAEEQAVIRMGVLNHDTSNGITANVCIPYKFGRWGGIDHAMDGLFGDFIFNKPPAAAATT